MTHAPSLFTPSLPSAYRRCVYADATHHCVVSTAFGVKLYLMLHSQEWRQHAMILHQCSHTGLINYMGRVQYTIYRQLSSGVLGYDTVCAICRQLYMVVGVC